MTEHIDTQAGEPWTPAHDYWSLLGKGYGLVVNRTADGANAFDTATGVLYRGHTKEGEAVAWVEVIVPANRAGAAIDVPGAIDTLRAFIAANPEPLPRNREVAPSADELSRLVQRTGWGRREIAEHYGRSVATADKWLREARAAFPDRMPPRSRGPMTTAERKAYDGKRGDALAANQTPPAEGRGATGADSPTTERQNTP